MAALLSRDRPRPSAEAGPRPVASPEGEERRLCRAGDQPVARDPRTGGRHRQVFARPDHPVELARVELPAGVREAWPPAAFAHARRVVWVQAGDLVVVADGQRCELAPGDCLALGPPSAVTFANEGVLPCTFAVVSARG